MHEPPDWSPQVLFKVGFFVELGLVLLAAVVGLIFVGSPYPFVLRLEPIALAWSVPATIPAVLTAILLTCPLGRKVRAFQRIYEHVKAILDKPLRELGIVELTLLSAAAGIGEEVFFRGVLQTIVGIHIASVIFGLLHALTPAYFLLATLMGYYLGWLCSATGNLLVPIVVHWLYDTLALWLLRREFQKDDGAPRAPEGDGS
jgi:hypothetical protein